MTVFHQFHKIEHLLLVERPYTKVVDDKQISVGKLLEKLRESTLDPIVCNLLEELKHMEIAHLKAKHTGLMAQGCSKPALTRTSRTSDDDREDRIWGEDWAFAVLILLAFVPIIRVAEKYFPVILGQYRISAN